MLPLLAILLLSGQTVHLNTHEIVALLDAREAGHALKTVAPEVQCVVITTADQKYTTKEDCKSIEVRLYALRVNEP